MKDRLRIEAKAALRAAHATAPADSGRRFADRFFKAIPVTKQTIVAGFARFGDEPDPLPLLETLSKRGVPTALPAIVTPASALVFRLWTPGDALVRGLHGTQEPVVETEIVRPDIVLVPLLAFDRQGRRLGRGGGYYDRTLAALRASGALLAVGFAYSGQEIASVPAENHDVELDWIVTETEAIKANTL